MYEDAVSKIVPKSEGEWAQHSILLLESEKLKAFSKSVSSLPPQRNLSVLHVFGFCAKHTLELLFTERAVAVFFVVAYPAWRKGMNLHCHSPVHVHDLVSLCNRSAAQETRPPDDLVQPCP